MQIRVPAHLVQILDAHYVELFSHFEWVFLLLVEAS